MTKKLLNDEAAISYAKELTKLVVEHTKFYVHDDIPKGFADAITTFHHRIVTGLTSDSTSEE